MLRSCSGGTDQFFLHGGTGDSADLAGSIERDMDGLGSRSIIQVLPAEARGQKKQSNSSETSNILPATSSVLKKRSDVL